MLAAAFEAAGVTTHPDRGGVAARLLYAPNATLAILVNETASDRQRPMEVEGRRVMIPVAAGRTRLVLFDGTGTIIAEK